MTARGYTPLSSTLYLALRLSISGYIGDHRIPEPPAERGGNEREATRDNRSNPWRTPPMSINVDDVEALRSILSALPKHQPKQVSKQEAITSLASELAAAQRRGYSADDLAQLMAERGIEINGPTLRNCLRRLKKTRRSRSKGDAQRAAGGATSSAPSAVSDDTKTAAMNTAESAKLSAPAQPRSSEAPRSVGSGSTRVDGR
jgi:hypothetical protein